MFTSILNTTVSSITTVDVLICIIAALALGFMIALTYMNTGSYSKDFIISLVLLPVLVQIVIMMVNGNVGTGVAVAGAFSLVRFRSAPGSAKEICTIFFAMAVGLATAMGQILFALIMTLIICIVFLILSKTSFGEQDAAERGLRITIPEDLDYTEIFDDIFQHFTKKAVLERVKTTNLGSMYELRYNIVFKDPSKEKEFIDEIRCRNGNLNIVCSRMQNQKYSL